MYIKQDGRTISNGHIFIYTEGEENERGVRLILNKDKTRCILGYW